MLSGLGVVAQVGRTVWHIPRPRSMYTLAPYGTWKSPISGDMLTRGSASLGELATVRSGEAYDVLYTLARPEDRGRVSLHCTNTKGESKQRECLSAQHGSVRSSVHEYGGGAFATLPHQRTAIFAHQVQKQHAVSRLDLDTMSVTQLRPPSQKRYADFGVSSRDVLLAVEEDHSDGAVRNNLVSLSVANGSVHTVHSKHDFYAYPRLSPDGALVAWVTWDQPAMPFWASELWVARVECAERLQISSPIRVAGGAGVVAQQPVWSSNDTLLYTHSAADMSDVMEVQIRFQDGAMHVSMPVAAGGTRQATPCDVQPPLWNLNVYVESSAYRQLLPRSVRRATRCLH